MKIKGEFKKNIFNAYPAWHVSACLWNTLKRVVEKGESKSALEALEVWETRASFAKRPG